MCIAVMNLVLAAAELLVAAAFWPEMKRLIFSG